MLFKPMRISAFLHNKHRYAFAVSLINDLSAVIAASDPSERRSKCLGLDHGR